MSVMNFHHKTVFSKLYDRVSRKISGAVMMVNVDELVLLSNEELFTLGIDAPFGDERDDADTPYRLLLEPYASVHDHVTTTQTFFYTTHSFVFTYTPNSDSK